MTDLEIEQLEQLMAALPETCDQCGKRKPGDELNYFADGHKLCDQCFAASSEQPGNLRRNRSTHGPSILASTKKSFVVPR